jgi:hypothetical protein
MRKQNTLVALAAFSAGTLLAGVVMLTTGAFGQGSVASLKLSPGSAVDVTCPNALSNSNVAADSETVNCAANTPPPPPPPASACNLQATPTASPASVAFCDPMSTPSTNPATNQRAGQLNGVVWGTAENQGAFPDDPIATTPSACGSGTTDYPANMEICNGHLNTTVANIGAGSLAMYVRQPFDFANRTGSIVFDVSTNTDHAASGNAVRDSWPELWVTDQPVPQPFSFEGATKTVPRNGFGIRLYGCTDPTSGNETTCPDGNNGTAVGQAAVVNNYALTDSATDRPLAFGTGHDILRSGPGQVNHFEVQVSTTQIEVYGTNPFSGTWDPATNPLIHLSTMKGFGTLGFTRGLVWLEHAAYNSNQPPPNEPSEYHTFQWGNLGFDGPVLPRDLGYDVPNNHQIANPIQITPEPTCSPCFGFNNAYHVPTNGSINETTPAIPASSISNAAGALLTFDFYSPTTVPTIRAAVNGHDVSIPWPYADNTGNSYRTIALSVSLSYLTAGANTITFSAGNWQESVDNIDIIALGAGGVVQPTSQLATSTTSSGLGVHVAVPHAGAAVVRRNG